MAAQVSVRKDRWFASFMVAVSALLLVQAYGYPAESSQFPRFLLVLQMGFSIILLVQAWRVGPAPPPQDAPSDSWASLYAPFKVFVAASMYVLAIEYLGYFAATALFLCAAMFWFGARRPVVVISVAAGFLLIVYALFVSFMGVRLPEGVLF